MISPTLKELATKIGVVPVFRYSAGVVPWSETELDQQISKLWMTAFKHAWTLSSNIDGLPMSLDRDDGGREGPSAVKEWTREGLECENKNRDLGE